MEESKHADTAYFVTLTYSPESIPVKNGKYTLDKEELQKYIKKLRHANEGTIKYYAIGEYGGITRRPHYHLIVFNVDTQSDFISCWTTYNSETNTFDLKGKIDIGRVERASIHYVTGYLIGPGFKYGKYEDTDVQQPFQLISKGIGENYLYDNYTWHKKEKRFYIQTEQGHKQKMPRYYKDRIFNVKEKMDFADEMQKLSDEQPENPLKHINQIRDTKKFNKNAKHKI